MSYEVIDNPLSDELFDALNEKEHEAISLLGISEIDSPKEIVTKIRESVDKFLAQDKSEEDRREYALQLGALWGSMVVKQYHWVWRHLDFGDEIQGIYLVSPGTLYCCPPLYFLNKILLGNNKGLDGNNDNTVMLLFNMLDGIETNIPEHKYQVVS